MSVLDRKVLRDIWRFRGQVFTIVLLVGAGVTVLVGSVSTYASLLTTQETYYRESRFADLWADVKRAPKAVLGKLSEIPGISVIEARIVKDLRVEWPQSELSVAGRIVSIPHLGEPVINKLALKSGRWLDPLRLDEILVNTAFAEAWSVRAGDPIDVILNGRIQRFTIVGTATSPEFVYAHRPGNPLPDDRTFVVLWAGEQALANAFDMVGAFNSIAVTLAPRALAPAVIADLDRALEPYGAPGAFERRDQPSHRFLSDELAEQRTLAITVPLVFFGIAAFLLNVVLGRLIEAQREQIAALKALGYPSLPIALHYAKFVTLVCAVGSLTGVLVGVRYGQGMMSNYRPFFRFPELSYVLPGWLPVAAVLASLAAGLAGVLTSLRRVLRLKPAVAMRPPAPPSFNRFWASSLAELKPAAKMVLRGMLGRPLRTGLTVVGLACAVPMVVLGLFWWDALAHMVTVQFDGIERGDATVTFSDPVSSRAVREIGHIPGVLAVEGQRVLPVRLRAGYRTYRSSLTGLATDGELRVPRNEDLEAIRPPPEGLMISRGLADRLGVRVGSLLTIEVLEGERPIRTVLVTALVDEILGFSAYMELSAVSRLMREQDLVSLALVRVDPAHEREVWSRISERPKVVAISVKKTWLRVFEEKIAAMVLISAVVLTTFGVIIAVGVVYNSARIALQERAWELASLRILGFSRAEASRLLFAELAIEMLIAIPLGLFLAQGIVELLLQARDNETFTIPAVISAATFASASLIVSTAGLLSAWSVRRRIDRLDLVAVLKTRD
ncbi:MAG: FtsX-like permease family protein [Microvirga sp.]|nr:FtsX-like permease family protein [Microvirga sp.]